MKIAVVTPVLGQDGGIGRVAEDTSLRLAGRGHQVTLFAPKNNVFRQNGVFTRSLIPVARYGHAAWVPQLKKMLDGFDIVHFHYPFIGGIGPALAWKNSRTQAAFCVSYHMDLRGRGAYRPLFRAHQKHYLPRIAELADRIIVSSMDYARSGDLSPYIEVLGEKLIEIPFAVDLERYAPSEKGARRDFTRFIFVGGLDRAHYFKGVEILLSAFQKLGGEHELLIVGDGDLRESYETEARNLGIDDRVRFCGRAGDEELPNYYRAADCLILPSVDSSEAFGLVLLEAQASGIPVIASSLPGVRVAFEDGVTGFAVPPREIPALAESMRRMAENPEEREKMGAAARKMTEELHSWDKIIKKLEGTYEQMSFVRRAHG